MAAASKTRKETGVAKKSTGSRKSTGAKLRRREVRTGSFSLTMTLPADVDGTKASASYEDGLLELRLPKRRPSNQHDVKVD